MTARALTADAIFSTRIPAWGAPVALALFALLVRMGLIWRTGFDGLYGQDPFAYLDYAAVFRHALAQGQWPPSFFWPIGYPALVAALSALLPLTVAAQTVSLASGVLAAVLVFLMVREILGNRPGATLAGLYAGLIAAGAGQLLISSLSTMSDAASLFWATLSGFGMLRFRRRYSLRWLALAAFALGWAAMTRWVYGLLIPVWGVALAVELRQVRRLLQAGVVAGVFFLFALLPQGLLIAKQAGGNTAAFVGDAQVYSWNPLNAFRSDIVNADGHFSYLWTIGNFYSLPLVEPDYIPIWSTPLVLLGVWLLRKRRTELVLLLGWWGVMWGFLVGVEWENWRFPLAFFPPLAILAGVGLDRLFEQMPSRPARLMAGWLGVGLVVASAWGLYDAGSFIGRQLDDRGIVGWLSARVPPDATVLTFGETATLQHYTPFRVIEMASESTESTEAIGRQRTDVFVLLNVQNVELQWQGLAPQINYQALEDHFVLRTVGARGPYVLYSVASK